MIARADQATFGRHASGPLDRAVLAATRSLPNGSRRLKLAILKEAAVTRIDALKIDLEGPADLAFVPFLRAAPPRPLPELALIENTSGHRRTDVFALPAQRGYTVFARSRQNLALRRG